jgi:hypothetical protein
MAEPSGPQHVPSVAPTGPGTTSGAIEQGRPTGDLGPPPAPPTPPPASLSMDDERTQARNRPVLQNLAYRGVQDASLRLRNTRWRVMDTTIPLSDIVFGTNTASSYFINGESIILWAEFAGNHPDCYGYPRCVVAIREDGSTDPMYFGGDDQTLYAIDCVDWRAVGDGPEIPSNDALAANGVEVVWRADPILCLHMGRPVYQRVTSE